MWINVVIFLWDVAMLTISLLATSWWRAQVKGPFFFLLLASCCGFAADFNVKTFGAAVCDGSTDDTASIQKTIDAAAASVTHSGGSGIVYFPPSSGFCKVTVLWYPSMAGDQGWLVSLFDNGLYANTIHLGSNNAYIGRASSFGGMSGSFLYGPTAEWQQPKGVDSPLVNISGISQVYVEGLDIQTQSSARSEVIHVHDYLGRGSVYLTFRRCAVGASDGRGLSLVVDSSSPTTIAGFGLKIEDSSLQLPISLTNFGQVTIEHSTLPKLSMTNLGIASDGDLEINDVLSEGLRNDDFLTIKQSPGQVTDITLRRVKIADSVNSYMVKNSSVRTIATVLIEQTPLGNYGKGLVDPSSASARLALECIGNGCDKASVVDQAGQALYAFQGFTSQGAVVYGSRYVPNPLRSLATPNSPPSEADGTVNPQ
jgi:Pectate lyase superfamily protein